MFFLVFNQFFVVPEKFTFSDFTWFCQNRDDYYISIFAQIIQKLFFFKFFQTLCLLKTRMKRRKKVIIVAKKISPQWAFDHLTLK